MLTYAQLAAKTLTFPPPIEEKKSFGLFKRQEKQINLKTVCERITNSAGKGRAFDKLSIDDATELSVAIYAELGWTVRTAKDANTKTRPYVDSLVKAMGGYDIVHALAARATKDPAEQSRDTLQGLDEVLTERRQEYAEKKEEINRQLDLFKPYVESVVTFLGEKHVPSINEQLKQIQGRLAEIPQVKAHQELQRHITDLEYQAENATIPKQSRWDHNPEAPDVERRTIAKQHLAKAKQQQEELEETMPDEVYELFEQEKILKEEQKKAQKVLQTFKGIHEEIEDLQRSTTLAREDAHYHHVPDYANRYRILNERARLVKNLGEIAKKNDTTVLNDYREAGNELPECPSFEKPTAAPGPGLQG